MDGYRRHSLLLLSALAAAVGLGSLMSWATWPVVIAPLTVTGELTTLRPDSTAEMAFRLRTADRRDVQLAAIAAIPDDWPAGLDGEQRKQLFIEMMLPLVAAANQRILADRARLSEMVGNGGPSSSGEKEWLEALAERYRSSPDDLATLLARVDIIPPSLAIAQAAIESAWGASRFAKQGNALFGQWVWNPDLSIRPAQQRANKGDYGIRRFATLAESTAHYVLNLNRHPAYRKLRLQRQRLRRSNSPLRGDVLANYLSAYSERGAHYAETLKTIISREKLGRFDTDPAAMR
jgi:Bax protein